MTDETDETDETRDSASDHDPELDIEDPTIEDEDFEDEATIAEIERTLAEFHQNPSDVLNRQPIKYDENNRPTQGGSPFSQEDGRRGRHIVASDQYRKLHSTMHEGVIIALSEVLPGRAPYAGNDLAENLVDKLRFRNLKKMHRRRRLRDCKLKDSPWSDDYWAIYKGVLGCRYADSGFPGSSDWLDNRNYIEANPAPRIVESGDQDAIRRLSPSEKYDLLVGDPDGTLTTAMWAQGRGFYERSGEVESWMGICHGWAPAAYMLPRPTRYVDALAADGRTKLRFYPSDIKALASLLWANAATLSRFIGSRANDKDPPMDANGRLLSARAFDTNPGTWHMSVVNQIGVARRSFVIDATYDYEVWNQPVYSYRYSYFNPLTRKAEKRLRKATIPYSEFANHDKFRKYRSKDVDSVVGIAMTMSYVVETSPSHRETDEELRDERHTVRYMYDLELDGRGRILGGEWYQNRHPDFLWTPAENARARTAADAYASGDWDAPTGVVPQSWRRAARHGSRGRKGAPLGKIVERLIEFSRR